VRFDTSLTTTLGFNAALTWACHETGHALGLLHHGEGCMPSTVPANAHFCSAPHQVGHINNNYQKVVDMKAIGKAAALAMLTTITACTGDATPEGQGVFENLAARHGSVSGSAIHRTPAEAMPQVRYSIDGADPISIADVYIVGDIVDVKMGRSFFWTESADEETRTEVDFNADGAQVSTLHVSIAVTRSIVDPNQRDELDPMVAPGSVVTLALALTSPVDVDKAAEELGKGSTVAALLYRSSPVFDYDPTLWAVLNKGAYFGSVGPDDIVTFAALVGDEGASLSTKQLEAPTKGDPIAIRSTESGWERA
jgi:hypothetical protein